MDAGAGISYGAAIAGLDCRATDECSMTGETLDAGNASESGARRVPTDALISSVIFVVNSAGEGTAGDGGDGDRFASLARGSAVGSVDPAGLSASITAWAIAIALRPRVPEAAGGASADC